jgi:hypothetical protein
MWWKKQLCREAITSLVDLLRHGSPDHRFEHSIERHKVNGRWIVTVAFLYVDCALSPGPIAVHVISEDMFARALCCADARGGRTPEVIARQLFGVIEAEEAEERVEASGV